jgi:heme a synthase
VPYAAPSRQPARGFSRLAAWTTVVSLGVVALGGLVRATDSGLACPTWPGCFSAGDFVPAADVGVWLEHTHRLLAGGLGLLVASLGVWALARYRDRPDIVWPAVGAGVAVIAQALLGAVVVLQLLRAELVTAHLGLGMAVVGLLLFLAVAAHGPATAGRHPGLARTSLGVAALCYVQILVGGHVTGVGAGLVYRDAPLNGLIAVAPIAGESQLYSVGHRALAVALLLAVAVLVRRARAVGVTGWLRRLPHLAAGLVAVQVLLGVANLVTELSDVTVTLHLAVASWLWAALVLCAVLAHRQPPDLVDAPTPAVGSARSGVGAHP